MKKYLEDLAYKACAGREMRTTLDQTPAWVLRDAELEKFAELVATHEREECAKLCHDEADDGTEGGHAVVAVRLDMCAVEGGRFDNDAIGKLVRPPAQPRDLSDQCREAVGLMPSEMGDTAQV